MSEHAADANNIVVGTTDEGRMWLVKVTAQTLAPNMASADRPYFVFRWPHKPFLNSFPDMQTASVWGTRADYYAIADITGELQAMGRGDGNGDNVSSRSTRGA